MVYRPHPPPQLRGCPPLSWTPFFLHPQGSTLFQDYEDQCLGQPSHPPVTVKLMEKETPPLGVWDSRKTPNTVNQCPASSSWDGQPHTWKALSDSPRSLVWHFQGVSSRTTDRRWWVASWGWCWGQVINLTRRVTRSWSGSQNERKRSLSEKFCEANIDIMYFGKIFCISLLSRFGTNFQYFKNFC